MYPYVAMGCGEPPPPQHVVHVSPMRKNTSWHAEGENNRDSPPTARIARRGPTAREETWKQWLIIQGLKFFVFRMTEHILYADETRLSVRKHGERTQKQAISNMHRKARKTVRKCTRCRPGEKDKTRRNKPVLETNQTPCRHANNPYTRKASVLGESVAVAVH